MRLPTARPQRNASPIRKSGIIRQVPVCRLKRSDEYSSPTLFAPDPAALAPSAEAAGTRRALRTWPDGEHTLYNHAAERDALVADWFAGRLTPASGS